MDKRQTELMITGIGIMVLLILSVQTILRYHARARRNVVKPVSVAGEGAITWQWDDLQEQMDALSLARNPFSAVEKPSAPVLVVTGIISDGANVQAIINDTLVSSGDSIEGYTVITIDSQRVVVEKNGEEKVLMIVP